MKQCSFQNCKNCKKIYKIKKIIKNKKDTKNFLRLNSPCSWKLKFSLLERLKTCTIFLRFYWTLELDDEMLNFSTFYMQTFDEIYVTNSIYVFNFVLLCARYIQQRVKLRFHH